MEEQTNLLNKIPNHISEEIKNAINDFIVEVISNLGNKVEKIYLYGSMARGDYNKDSDIDIMILINSNKEEMIKDRRLIADLAYDIEEKYNFSIWISPIVKNFYYFFDKLEYSYFYTNVEKEGVELFS